MVVFCHYLAMKGRLSFWKKFSTHIYCQRWSGKSFMQIWCSEVPKPSYPPYFDWLSERHQPLFKLSNPQKILARSEQLQWTLSWRENRARKQTTAPHHHHHCQIEARHKRMKKEGRKYSNLLALKVLLDSLWPMITIPIPSIPSLPTHKASLII